MAYFLLSDVNQWLARSKYDARIIEPEVEKAVKDAGFGIVSLRYNTTTWVDQATTPRLVWTALSMIYAAWWLQRQIGDDTEAEIGQTYPIRLEARGMAILNGIATELIDLPEADPDPELVGYKTALFFPTDESTQLAEDDPCDPNGTPRVFSMGTRF